MGGRPTAGRDGAGHGEHANYGTWSTSTSRIWPDRGRRRKETGAAFWLRANARLQADGIRGQHMLLRRAYPAYRPPRPLERSILQCAAIPGMGGSSSRQDRSPRGDEVIPGRKDAQSAVRLERINVRWQVMRKGTGAQLIQGVRFDTGMDHIDFHGQP